MTEPSGNRDLQATLQSTKLGDLALTTRPTLTLTDTVSTAAAEMRATSHGCAVIRDEDKVVGIFTERDLLRHLGSSGDMDATLADVMTRDPKTMTTEHSLIDAIRLMDEGGYRRLPVVDRACGDVAVVDVKDVTHFLVELFPEAVYNQATHEQLTTRRPEGA